MHHKKLVIEKRSIRDVYWFKKLELLRYDTDP